ncbi:hypothetical protein PSTG_07018 [Puccinia striiformis f. sp. tritici PST-78]|uniref:DDE Tnp4 domain-containing protein n=1 Tax=Puccinia striiformis f. sp. tritici PST-78 TaxID=1165861 RepID=A0A0L0VKC5_9BASI|nr:hypothetical protein PSTG_07018 [Puccinia striiformis f. sp. tritici PST-78]
MCRPSDRQQLIRDIFLFIIYHHQEDTEHLLDSSTNLPSIPSLGFLLFPQNPSLNFLIDNFFDDETEAGEMLQLILSNRYLSIRPNPITHEEFNLAKMFDMRDEDFKQAVRTTRDGFMWLLEQIYAHPIFHNNSPRQQLPIPHQLALTLERLGSNGNGASVGRFSRNLSVGRGTVIKVSRRVIEAINSLSVDHIVWPSQARRQEISAVLREEGFEGCVGFVDGTTIPLHQRPGLDGEVYWNRKKQYSINVQVICDCDKYITSFMAGWPGSCGDSMVFKHMKVHLEPDNYFDPGQYLIGDSAYGLTMTTIPAYKAPASNIKENTEFNYCLAKSRVRNKHTIGILKGRWASLQGLRLQINEKKHMIEVIRWINSCVTLHNMLAHLGDSWDDRHHGSGNDSDDPPPEVVPMARAEINRQSIQDRCLEKNYETGVLPISL